MLFSGSKRSTPFFVGFMITGLAFLYGCERNGTSQDPQPDSWPQAAVVAELSHLPSLEAAEATLADLKDMGFDTVLVGARGMPRPLYEHWLDTAKAKHLRTVAWIDLPEAAGPASSGERLAVPDEHIRQVDGLIMTIEQPGDLSAARVLREALEESGSDTVLIADVRVPGSVDGPQPAMKLPTDVFDAVLLENPSRDVLSLLDWEDPMPPSVFADRYQLGGAAEVQQQRLARWHRIPHCRTSDAQPCSEDLRLLVMGFMQAPAPVTGLIEGPFWRDIYASLIQLRRDTPLIKDGKMEWYAADDMAGVLAFRITNDRRQHVLVALNVSHNHHELPLPSGFMAVSKIKLWASYEPRIRELVTSKPVALPAGSVVVVVEN